MTEYMKKSFSVYPGASEAFRSSWDAVFGPKEPFEPTPSARSLPTESFKYPDDVIADTLAEHGVKVTQQLVSDLKNVAEEHAEDVAYHRSIQSQVTGFHVAFDQPILDKPFVPDAARVQLRLRLVTEEFMELLQAHGIETLDVHAEINSLIKFVSPVDVNLVEAADALADLDYVVEGTRLEYGIDGEPIAREVHRSNMEKCHSDGKPRYNEHGKVVKPEGWTPPDIRGELVKQGMKP